MDFARAHDDDIWQCTCDILHVDPVQAHSVKDVASLPLVLGGLGHRSAERVRVSAFWASWADCIPTIHARHCVLADVLVRQLEGPLGLCMASWGGARLRGGALEVGSTKQLPGLTSVSETRTCLPG